ncbi:hypothetical protein B0H13DRAFT_1909768 [Mycena leptocephala]|nr:hypothetical protein B0H13DRAFT_1909768 [Mycena leptocephala]
MAQSRVEREYLDLRYFVNLSHEKQMRATRCQALNDIVGVLALDALSRTAYFADPFRKLKLKSQEKRKKKEGEEKRANVRAHGPAPSRTGSFGLQLNRCSQSNEEQMRAARYQALYLNNLVLCLVGLKFRSLNLFLRRRSSMW